MYKDTSYLGSKLPRVTFSKRNKHCSFRLMEQNKTKHPLTSHPKPRVGKLNGDKFGKERSDFNVLLKNRYRFCTIPLVGLEEEIIDKDFRQSYWLALQFVRTMKNKPNRIFYRGVAQASQGKRKSNYPETSQIT